MCFSAPIRANRVRSAVSSAMPLKFVVSQKNGKKGGVVPRRTLQRQNAIIPQPQPTRRLHIQMPKSKTQKNRKKRVEMRRAKALNNSKVYSSNKK